MKKTLLILGIFTFLFSCNNSSKTNESINSEVPEDMASVNEHLPDIPEIKELLSLMESDSQKFELRKDGFLAYDSGAAATGRFAGDIRDMDFRLRMTGDKSKEEAAGSPSAGIVAVIDVKCKSGKDCLEDSVTGKPIENSVLSFTDKEQARKVLKLLKEIQRQTG